MAIDLVGVSLRPHLQYCMKSWKKQLYKILTNCWEGERSNKAIRVGGTKWWGKIKKKAKCHIYDFARRWLMWNTDKFEGSLNSKKKKKKVRIVRTVQEGITKSDGVKLSKRKFKLNLRKKSLLKYIRLLSYCPWGAVQTAACRLFSLGKMFSGMQLRKLQKRRLKYSLLSVVLLFHVYHLQAQFA